MAEKAYITLYGAPDIPTITFSSEDPSLAGNVHAQLLAVIAQVREKLDALELRELALAADSTPSEPSPAASEDARSP